jgi:hypothetical protein
MPIKKQPKALMRDAAIDQYLAEIKDGRSRTVVRRNLPSLQYRAAVLLRLYGSLSSTLTYSGVFAKRRTNRSSTHRLHVAPDCALDFDPWGSQFPPQYISHLACIGC